MGGDEYQEHFKSAAKFREIVAAIETGRYRFKEVHLSVAGTRLETTTSEINSSEETTKFRMQHWTAENFEALVHSSNPTRVKEVMRQFPFLEDIASNGRCAFYLLKSMKAVWIAPNQIKGLVNGLVLSVANYYILSNGLKRLESPVDKWNVARSVFRELDRSSKQPNVAFFPEFDDLASKTHRSIAHSLLDVNVETINGEKRLALDSMFALSMSPAIAIVIANLLSTDADVSWDWKGLECTAALSEMKRMIVNTKGKPRHPSSPVIQLSSPVPTTAAKFDFYVPVVDNQTVVLNGPAAKYADVIAPYRLVQVKHSHHNGKSLALLLQDELDNMGLTMSEGYHVQKMTTLAFYTLWKNGQKAPSIVNGNPILQNADEHLRFECHPYNTLNSKQVLDKHKIITGKIMEDGSDQWTGLPGNKLLTEFDASHPVTAVFVTNCISINIKRKNAEGKFKTCFTVKKSEVDWEGVPTGEGVTFSDFGLRQNVNVRFLFY